MEHDPEAATGEPPRTVGRQRVANGAMTLCVVFHLVVMVSEPDGAWRVAPSVCTALVGLGVLAAAPWGAWRESRRLAALLSVGTAISVGAAGVSIWKTLHAWTFVRNSGRSAVTIRVGETTTTIPGGAHGRVRHEIDAPIDVFRGDTAAGTPQTFEFDRARWAGPVEVNGDDRGRILLRPDRGEPPPTVVVDLGGGVTMDLVLVPAGTFTMGSAGDASTQPLTQVTIPKPFYIGRCEVTQAQWSAVTGRGARTDTGADHPAEVLRWEDARDFVVALGGKVPGPRFGLPSEARWEYACRAGTTTAWSFGDDASRLPDHAWIGSNSDFETHPVGQKLPNAWGLHDMHGNVWEWCEDTWTPDLREVRPDGSATVSPGVRERVLRGGAAGVDASPRNVRLTTSAGRFGCAVVGEIPVLFLGLRVTREVGE